jgi:hypothetical protein
MGAEISPRMTEGLGHRGSLALDVRAAAPVITSLSHFADEVACQGLWSGALLLDRGVVRAALVDETLDRSCSPAAIP